MNDNSQAGGGSDAAGMGAISSQDGPPDDSQAGRGNDATDVGSAPDGGRDDSQAGDGTGSRARVAEPEEALGHALGRAVGARVAALPAGHGPGPGVIADLAAARARRRTATRAGLAAAAAVALVAVVVGWRLVADDDPGSMVVVAAPSGGDQAEDPAASVDADADPAGVVDPAPAAASDDPGSADGAGTDEGAGPDPLAAGADDGQAADSADAPTPLITPSELSTGPALRWSEIEPDFWELWGLQSLGDGRVLAYASHNEAQLPQIDAREVTAVTSDGINWTEVNLPSEIHAQHVAVSGDRWVVAGFNRLEPPDSGETFLAGVMGRVFVSNDGAATWTELDIHVPPDTAPTSPWIEHRSAVVSALASGDDIVVVVSVGADLNVEGLVEAGGLLPEGTSALGWSYYGGYEDSVVVTLGDPAATEQANPAAFEDTDGGVDFLEGETRRFSFDELGLTAEEQDALHGETRSLMLLWSDGATVGSRVEVTDFRDSLLGRGAATEDGFVIYLAGPSQGVILSSPDGRTWVEHPYDTFGLFDIVVHGGAVWTVDADASGSSLKRADIGAIPESVASFEGVQVMQLHAGPGGLVADATLAPPAGTYEADLDAIIPEVRIAADGYELRYSEPPGGVTLWDLGADEAVRVFEAEELGGDGPIDGVREEADETGLWVTFTDPDTGEDLVTFTPEHFDAAFEAMDLPEGIESGVYEPSGAGAGDGWTLADNWVGWSADGTAWGWQTMTEAFGIGADEAWVEIGVGGDFVLAAVQPFGTPPVPAPDGSEALVADIAQVRVFLAPLP